MPTRFPTVILAGMLGIAVAQAETWPMRNRDMQNTGRASFSVPAPRQNSTFFDIIRWQKPSPCCPGEFDNSAMVFFDGAGPGGSDIIAGGYHWPKGVQAMDRHTGKFFWFGNPEGGETIGRATPAFSNTGTTLYVINDACPNPVMAFPTISGPTTWRGLANPSDPNAGYLGLAWPMVAPDGRVFSTGWNSRSAGVTDNGTNLSITWVADSDTGTILSGNAMYQYGPSDLRIITTGRWGMVKSYSGATGAAVWSKNVPGGDGTPTVDPANGNIYIPAGFDDVYVIGLSKNGANLWGANPYTQVYDYTGENAAHAARTTGCLSHDGSTFYFQTTTTDTSRGQGRLWAIRTSNGTVKWSYTTYSRSPETWTSSPIVTPNGIIIVGNNYGNTYYALRDDGAGATLLDTFVVEAPGNAGPVPTLSADGLLYLELRTPWINTNGNTDIPSFAVENVYTAFDLKDGAKMYELPPEGPLAAPSGLDVTPFYSTAQVRWSAVADPSVAGYLVYRRTSTTNYTLPVKRVLRTSFTDYNLTPGETYYYIAMPIDGSGTVIGHYSEEVSATLATDPSAYSKHKNFDLLMVFYTGGYAETQINQMVEGLEQAMLFTWRTSQCQLNLDPTWIFIDSYPPASDWNDALQNDLRARGVQDGQFDLAYLVGNGLAGCYGGYLVFRNTPASLGTVCGVPFPGKSPAIDYTIVWCMTHELHHAMELMQNLCPGTPEVYGDHFPWNYPDALGLNGVHMDWSMHFDGIAATNRDYGDKWMLLPPPYDGYIECLDSDHDGLPNADNRVWMDELHFNSDRTVADTDGDGLDDLHEFSAANFRGTDPRNPDTDGDGVPDGADQQPLYAVKPYIPRMSAPPVINGTIESGWPALRTGYYFTHNSTDFTLKTYCGWDSSALYFAVESSRQLRFMLSIDGSGQDGRFESPVRYVTGTTDTMGPDNKDQQIGDSWADGNHIHWDYGGATADVYGRGTINGSQVASSYSGGLYRTEVKIPRALPPGAGYTWYPPGSDTPVVDGLTLEPGHIIGLSLTVSNYAGSDSSEFSGTWTSLFETYTLVDFILTVPADLDPDGDVDGDDLAIFESCASGPTVPCTTNCAKADFDKDGDVDQEDFAIFQRCYSGAGHPAAAACGL